MTQVELAAASGLGQATLSSIEGGRVTLGVERAKRLAIALRVHSAVLIVTRVTYAERRRVLFLTPSSSMAFLRRTLSRD